MGDLRDHWEGVYTSKAEAAVSWYQPRSGRSLAYITAAASKTAPIIDVGGGASTLVDDLLLRGYSDVTVLDLAEGALAKSKARLGPSAVKVSWIVADITRWQPPRRYLVWRDRAVFHFLTKAEDQDAYIAALKAGTVAGATAIIATFTLEGPDKCSGLPVQRHSPETMSARPGPAFALTGHSVEIHKTSWGAEQRFSYGVFRRVA